MFLVTLFCLHICFSFNKPKVYDEFTKTSILSKEFKLVTWVKTQVPVLLAFMFYSFFEIKIEESEQLTEVKAYEGLRKPSVSSCIRYFTCYHCWYFQNILNCRTAGINFLLISRWFLSLLLRIWSVVSGGWRFSNEISL